MECSQIVRRQSNNCPICRTKVSTFIQIKDEHQPEKEVKPSTGAKKADLEKNMKQKEDSKMDDEGEEEEEEEEDHQ